MRLMLLAALLLAGCDARTGADGYRFEGREIDLSPVSISIVAHPSRAALLAEAERRGAEFGHGREGMAFAILRPGARACEIHIVQPETRWAPEWLGHETAHCFYGEWHR